MTGQRGNRQISFDDIDAIAAAIFDLKMLASVVSDAADDMERPAIGDDWRISARSGERVCHFGLRQLEATARLEDLFNQATGGEA